MFIFLFIIYLTFILFTVFIYCVLSLFYTFHTSYRLPNKKGIFLFWWLSCNFHKIIVKTFWTGVSIGTFWRYDIKILFLRRIKIFPVEIPAEVYTTFSKSLLPIHLKGKVTIILCNILFYLLCEKIQHLRKYWCFLFRW